MITVAQLAALETSAHGNIARPETRCQVAMADVYKLAGLLPAGVEIPEGPRDASRWSNRSLFREWLEGAGGEYFAEVEPQLPGDQRLQFALPGDLLCFRLGHVEHHVAILLSGGRLVHVFGSHGVQIAPCIPDAWAKRLSSVWRIKS